MNVYQVVACQGAFRTAHNHEELNENIDHALEMIQWGHTVYSHRDPVRLYAFGEMNICGIPGLTVKDHKNIAITIPGPETERFVKLARKLKTYIVPGSWIEYDPDYPDVFFNACYLAGPEGVLAKYRKMNPVPGMELCVSPAKLLTKGYNTEKTPLFPVVETEIGSIGMFICYDSFFPEVARQLAYNGAEILVGVTADFYPGGDRILSYWNNCTRVRSFENNCYGLYVNGGGTLSQTAPISMVGRSQIVDYQGRILSILDGGEAMTMATFNLDMLRHARDSRNLLTQNHRDVYNFLETPWPPKSV